jgi:tetratricopeptide (TPR) repeat protein
MAKRRFRDELERKAARAILTRSVYRWESAIIIAATLSLSLLALVEVIPAFFGLWQWWFWLVLGGLGEAALVWSSVQDPEFRAKAVAEMFREKFDARQIRSDKLRQQAKRALEYRERIEETINQAREGIIREHLTDVSRSMNPWLENVFRLARRLDAYEQDAVIHQDLQTVDPAIESLKKRLAVEDDGTVQRQISQAIAQRQIQRDNLRKLQNVMERAEFQLESTITAMGTVYSQVMILDSREVASGRARRLQDEIDDQVQTLQDVVQTMDEVYRAGSDPLGLGLDVSAGVVPASGAGSSQPAAGQKGQARP